jgi:hypothetical protein
MDKGSGFEWKKAPYEYDYETLPIKLIIGSHQVEKHLSKSMFSPDDPFWSEGIASYIEAVQPHLRYPRTLKVAE